jgi:hypothetical protein
MHTCITYIYICNMYVYNTEDMEPSSLPIPLSLIISDVISSGGGGMGGGDANYSYARSPLSTLLSSALAPPASSPGGQLKSPKSPLLLVVSPGAGENITQ